MRWFTYWLRGNEANCRPPFQIGGKILADRQLSRLLHDDWPSTIEELEAPMGTGDHD